MGHQNSFIECVSIIMDGKKAFHVNKGSVGMDEVTFSLFFFFFFQKTTQATKWEKTYTYTLNFQ